MRLKVLAAAIAVLAAAAEPAAARDLRMAATGPVKFRACNHSGYPVFVGAMFMPVGSAHLWRNEGWKLVATGACRDIFSSNNWTFYARAEVKGDPSKYWGGDANHCVVYPGPYKFDIPGNAPTCTQGEPAGMNTFHSDGTSPFVWTLNP